MIFLDPKSDIAFKKLFGDIAHKNIVISFLNSILQRSDDMQIVDVVMNDPSNLLETHDAKTSIVDVRCTDQQNNQYIIKMQLMTKKNYKAHAQYYTALGISQQLSSGGKYNKLVPVIFVGILDFELLETFNYLSHYQITDTQNSQSKLELSEFFFIELKKFNKPLDSLETILDKWIYFLKNALALQIIPPIFKEPALKEAFGVLAQSNWSRAELEAHDRYLDSIRSSASQLDTAKEKGIEIGLEKGREEGKLEEKIDLAKKMLTRFDIATITEMTGLSKEIIEKLKNIPDLNTKKE